MKSVELFLALGSTATLAACGGPADTTEDASVGDDVPGDVAPAGEEMEDEEESEESEESDESEEGGEGGEG
ncbi:MAG: hypothetical protein IGR76_16625 [Synechococcales cyanobacterium T60_A2020_003]|nr:hypothetical protein [Synechococcales cyanobacterium T60_A2020_003]